MHRRPRLLLGLSAGLVALLLAVFGALIVKTQQTARQDVEQRFSDRALDAAGSVGALFSAALASGQEVAAERFGTSRVDPRVLDAHARRGRTPYLAVLDESGRLLAINSRAPEAAVARLESRPPTVEAVVRGAPYRASDVMADVVPGAGVIEYVTSFETPSGRRMTASGVPLQVLNVFISEFLAGQPNAENARALTVDSRGLVVGAPGVERAGGLADGSLVAASREAASGSYGEDRYFVSAPISGTTWRVLLDARKADLYAPISGARRTVPWLILAAFSIAALAALLLVRRSMAAARALSVANGELTMRAAALQRSNEELEQFASIASHDLREPLRKVQAFGEQLELRHGDALSDEARDFLRRMRNASDRMETLIDDLLAFARISTRGSAFRRVSLDQVLHEVLGDLEVVIEESSADILAAELPELDADPVQMRQLLQNLISNALKFRRPGVVPEVGVDGRVLDGWVELRVRDNGIGFDNHYAERIFGVFRRLHARTEYPGTGIGLALCRKIVERHGGTIVASGHTGEGATFTVRLPQFQPEASVDPPSSNGSVAEREREPAVA